MSVRPNEKSCLELALEGADLIGVAATPYTCTALCCLGGGQRLVVEIIDELVVDADLGAEPAEVCEGPTRRGTRALAGASSLR
jgi:hypothetical protein